MSAASPFVEFAAGAALLQQGEPARAMYILETGRVEVSRDGVVLGELGPGEFVGEMAIVQDQPHSATVTARTAVRALELDQAAFHAVLRANPEVGVQVMRRLVRMLEASEARRAELQAGAASAGAASKSKSVPASSRADAAQPPAAKPGSPVASPAAKPAAEAAAASAAASPAARPEAAPQPAPAAQRKPEPGPAPSPPPASPQKPAKPPAAAPAAAPAARGAAAAAPPTPTATATADAAPGRFALRHGQGRIELDPGRSDWRIGRLDPATGQVPEVDLGALDVARSLSRRHARLVREGTRLLLSEEPGVVNGTWINGQRLEAGNALPVRPGDRLRFGAVEVELIES